MSRICGRRLLLVVGLAATATVGPLAVPAASAAPPVGFSATRTVTRSHLNSSGTQVDVVSKKVHVTVSETSGLRGRQDVDVTWSGAMPTGGVQPDLNSVLAPQQEYPMVLLECRGKDNPSVPAAQRVAPTTCWTHGSYARYSGIYYTPYSPWRLDRYATKADRAAVVGRPAKVPAACPSAAATEHWVPFTSVDGTTFPYGNNGCAGLPPEDYTADSSLQAMPENATFAATSKDGSGSTKFDIWTQAEDASLGCSASVACTLEIIPIMGISCDPFGRAGGVPSSDVPDADDLASATSLCETTGNYEPGQLVSASEAPAVAVSGALWWSASNWRNRIAVPLSFAPVSNACNQVGGGAPVSVYGSELMTEATTQWAPSFCLDPKLFKFTHVQTAEPLARSLLQDPTSGVDAAFSTEPQDGGFARPTVQAPVAVSGFSISYNIDDENGNAVTSLRMTPRLLAKLITESYPGDDFDRFKTGQFPYLKDNPVNITDDPEFEALNPNIKADIGLPGAASLIMLSADSDVTEALTAYLNADPEARAWLNGTPDPWGMVVNPAYKKIKLPVSRWPLLDTTLPDFGEQVLCTQSDPTPWLPLVASPTPTLATTSLDVQFASPTGKIGCGSLGDANGVLYQWTALGRMQPGSRFVIGVTSLGEAARYDLESAALQTSSGVDPTAKFTTASGRTFVSATTASLTAAAHHLATNKTAHMWTLSPSALAKDASAYPGLMLVNADVPTSGLSAGMAKDYAELLRFAAGPGQKTGTGNGQLPQGYLPMTAANGLGKLANFTLRAADAVQAQQGAIPPLLAPPSTAGGGGTSSSGAGGSSGVGGNGGGSGSGVGGGAGSPARSTPSGSSAGSASASAAPGDSPLSHAEPAAAQTTVDTPSTGLGIGGVVLPVVLGLGLLGLLLAGGFTYPPSRWRR